MCDFPRLGHKWLLLDITHWCLLLFFFTLVRAFYDGYYTLTSIFNPFLHVVYPIEAKNLDYPDVKSTFNMIFRLLKVVVCLVGQSTDQFSFAWIMDCTLKDLVHICTKICSDNCLWMPYKCAKFQPDWSSYAFASYGEFYCLYEKKKTTKVYSLISCKRHAQFSSNLVCNLP